MRPPERGPSVLLRVVLQRFLPRCNGRRFLAAVPAARPIAPHCPAVAALRNLFLTGLLLPSDSHALSLILGKWETTWS